MVNISSSLAFTFPFSSFNSIFLAESLLSFISVGKVVWRTLIKIAGLNGKDQVESICYGVAKSRSDAKIAVLASEM